MLKKIQEPKQWAGEARRIVFADARFDLFVWLDAEGNVDRFQLGYDKPGPIRVFEWLNGQLFHHRVDNGEGTMTRIDMMGLLVPDDSGRPVETADEVARSGVDSDGWIVDQVVALLRRG